jgi:hypothetical protein
VGRIAVPADRRAGAIFGDERVDERRFGLTAPRRHALAQRQQEIRKRPSWIPLLGSIAVARRVLSLAIAHDPSPRRVLLEEGLSKGQVGEDGEERFLSSRVMKSA